MEYRAIRKLPEEIVGKIAAGEVVESPAAAIKELVENSIDAGAKNITVEIRDGGISYLRVTDNGSGIRREDVRMAFERHATSKISKADDLFHLSSLGFRGEALASIAAVSKVTLTTRTPQDERGTRVICTGGVIETIADAASPGGTTIVARDLFFNTPVRLKFLKKPATEAARVCDMMLRMIVSHPQVAFRLISNEKQVYMSPGNGDLRSVAFCLYGRDVAKALIDVKGGGSIGVHGLVGVGPLARANRTHQTFIINGRYVKSALLAQALEDACRERVTVGHYPICLLHLELSGAMVDVNVHPNKLEVRFSDENLIYQNVKGIISDCFQNEAMETAPTISLETQKEPSAAAPIQITVKPAEEQKPETTASKTDDRSALGDDALKKNRTSVYFEKGETVLEKKADILPEQASRDETFGKFVSQYFASPAARAVMREQSGPLTNVPPLPFAPYADDAKEKAAAKKETAPVATLSPEKQSETSAEETIEQVEMPIPMQVSAPVQENPPVQPSNDRPFPFKILGVLFDTYILLEQDDKMLLLDQHAAHERVLYERMMKSIDVGSASQGLLVSQIIRITPVECERLETYREEIAQAGFEIEWFGDDSVRITAVPMVLGTPQVKETFMELMDQLGELRVLNTKEKRREAILQMACKHAVKGGDKLSPEEIVRLLSDVLASDAPPTCPHGRPLVVSLSRTEIEKRFKRINN